MAGLDGSRVDVDTGGAAFPYLVTVTWEAGGDPLIVVLSRDQRVMRLLAADPATGATTVLREDTDPRWVDIVPGVPARTGDGRIAWAADSGGTRRLLVGTPGELAGGTGPAGTGPAGTGPAGMGPAGTGPAVTPPGLHVREILSVDGDAVLFTASAADPAAVGLWLYRPAGPGPRGLQEVSPPGGVHGGTRAGGTTVMVSRTMNEPGPSVLVLADIPDRAAGTSPAGTGRREQEQPGPGRRGQGRLRARRPGSPCWPRRRTCRPRIRTSSRRGPGKSPARCCSRPGTSRAQARCRSCSTRTAGRTRSGSLPPRARSWTSQWLAEQGFAVLVADGRGTPGRGPEWEREVWHDLAVPVLEDQVEALEAAAARHPDLDTSRVAIRGWSFGGYLAALAVLRRPDVFHAAVAGAPVTDWRLYDTHYTERYLGLPGEQPQVYEQSSLLADAPRLTRPLLLIHGLADDNVVVAHTLRMSSALLAAGRPHRVLPLSGVTHMTPQEDVAENLLLLQVDFLRETLGISPMPGPRPGPREGVV